MRKGKLRRFGFLAACLIASTALPSSAGADSITTVTSVPLSNSSSVFDVSHLGNSYSLGAGTLYNSNGSWDVRDLFGGQFSSVEPGNVIFADFQPIGTVETVNVTLASAVSLGSFNLYLADDGSSGGRSTREFKLYAGAMLLDDVNLLDSSGSQSFTNVYGGRFIEITGTLSNAPVAASYSLQFFQNQNSSFLSGLRAQEFEAFVPEPASVSLLVLTSFGLVSRRRRA